MLFLSTKQKLTFDLLKTLLICLLFFQSTDVSSLAPLSKFNSCRSSEKKEFLKNAAALFSVLYLSLHNTKDPEKHKRIKKEFIYLNCILRQKGVYFSVDKVEYMCSQPEVVYCTLKIGNETSIIRTFNSGFGQDADPANVLREVRFNGFGKVVQFITKGSYNVIKIGEKSIAEKPVTGFDKYLFYAIKIIVSAYHAISFIFTLEKAGTYMTSDSLNLWPGFISQLDPWISSLLLATVLGLYLSGKLFDFLGETPRNNIFEAPSPQSVRAEINIRSLGREIKDARDGNKKLLIGIETEWLSDVYGKKCIDRMIDNLRKKYKGKIEIVHSSRDNLFMDVIERINRVGILHADAGSNIVIIGEKSTFEDAKFRWLSERKIGFLAIDAGKLDTAKTRLKDAAREGIYVDFAEILEIALKLALNKDLTASQSPRLSYDPEINPRLAVFKPDFSVLSICEIDRIHRAQLKSMQSA